MSKMPWSLNGGKCCCGACCPWTAYGASEGQYSPSRLPDSFRVDWEENVLTYEDPENPENNTYEWQQKSALFSRDGLNYSYTSGDAYGPIAAIENTPEYWWLYQTDGPYPACCLDSLSGDWDFDYSDSNFWRNTVLTFNGGNSGTPPGWPTSVTMTSPYLGSSHVLASANGETWSGTFEDSAYAGQGEISIDISCRPYGDGWFLSGITGPWALTSVLSNAKTGNITPTAPVGSGNWPIGPYYSIEDTVVFTIS